MYLGLNRLFAGLEAHLKALRNERGASAVEYGLLVALIAIVVIGAVTLLGGNLNTVFTNIANALTPGGP